MQKIRQKLSNFWYYYKVHTIVAVVVIAILAVLFSQCAAKERYDYAVVLNMATVVEEPTADLLAGELAQFGEDLNGDGVVTVEVINCTYGSNDSVRINQLGKLQARLMMPETVLFILDEVSFSNLDAMGLFGTAEGFDAKMGRALSLNGTAMDAAVQSRFGNVMPAAWYLCVRGYDDTALEGDEEAAAYAEQSRALVSRLLVAYKAE